MPTFDFNVVDGPSERVEVPSLTDAKCEAVRFAGRMICNCADDFWNAQDFQLTVSDDSGLILFSLHLIATEAPALRTASGG